MDSTNLHADAGFEPMTVRNTAFLVDRLGLDCHQLQFLRELTQNSLEALQRTGSPGEIVWDAENHGTGADGKPVRKLSITDNGAGMTGPELERYINQLSSSGSEQGVDGNYGVGAKIAAATRNPHGVIYESWQDGQGNKIHLYRDGRTGQYGLKQWDLGDDQYAYHVPLDDAAKPDLVQQHGTKVTLLGTADTDNTMQPPEGTPSPSRWISKYLNTRYFKFSDGVSIQVREGWDHPDDKDRNVLRTLTGMEAYLHEHAMASGSVKLSGATAHWWILRDESAIQSNSGHIESSGHVAALYQDELYETQSGITGTNRLQQFGVLFGHRQVVIYVEPRNDRRHVITTNTARTHLLRDGQPLPWADWARQFRQKMPPQLRRFVEEKGTGASDSDHKRSIRKRLRHVLHLFQISRYRPTKTGTEKVTGGSAGNGKSASAKGQVKRSASKPSTGDGGGRNGTGGSHGKAKDGKPGRKVKADPFPNVTWISTEDGSREPGQLEDRAARLLVEQNLLQINADFGAFTDMIDHCSTGVTDQPGARDVAETAVRSWYEQTLVETVLGVQALQQRKEWSPRDVEQAISPESLTAAVMPKYHVHQASRREITRQLGAYPPNRAHQKGGTATLSNRERQPDRPAASAALPEEGLRAAIAVQETESWN